MTSFQDQTITWMLECFSDESLTTCKRERAQRFVEEALELVQARGMTKEDVLLMVDYVFNRPVGESAQEVGGVMLTLACLCWHANLDMDKCGYTELSRVKRPEVMQAIREKQASKTAILGSVAGGKTVSSGALRICPKRDAVCPKSDPAECDANCGTYG